MDKSIVSKATLIIAGALVAASTHAADVDFSASKGLDIKGDGFDWRIGGRIHADSAWYDEDVTPLDDDADFRRARIKSTLTIADDWRLGGEYDFGGTNTGWKVVTLQYNGVKHWRFSGGNQVAPFSMAELGSSDDSAFMERSIATALSPGLLTGVSASTWGHHWTASGGYFGNELSNESQRTSDGEGGVMRFTVSPIAKKRTVLHFGIAGEYRTPNDHDLIRLRTRPESYMTDVRFVDTRNILDVDDTTAIGLEAAAIAGPFTLQGEYQEMSVSRKVGSDLDFSGWYGEASVFLTGDRRTYSKSRGVIGAPHIRNKWGAVELAVRYGELDLTDKDVTGGEENNLAIGVNWYVNRNVRLMLNYIEFDASPNRNGIDENGSIVAARLQLVL